MKAGRLKVIILEIIIYVGLLISYIFVIAEKYDYMGFIISFDPFKFIIGLVVFLILIFLSLFVRYGIVWAIWEMIFSLFMVPEIIMFQFADTSYIQIVSLSLVLTLLVFVSKIKRKFSGIRRVSNSRQLLTIGSILMFIPFLQFIRYIDLKNLLLIDVYKTRMLFRNVGDSITGYLNAPLVRILLPVLVVGSIERKKWKSTFFFLLMILYVYLCGALKSVFMGLIALLIFYRGGYYEKIKYFLNGVGFLTIAGTIIAKFTGNVFLLDAFVRRVFFVPPYLNDIYNRFFSDNFTYFAQSGVRFAENDKFSQLSMFVGEHVLGEEGLNANVGTFTEGYISLGFPGLILMAVVICLIITFIHMCDIDNRYFGILFVYIYYFNTSFLTTLLLTHGLSFFLVMCFMFLRKDKGKKLIEKGERLNG
ncbi:hypothetical protein [Tetragenococcus halophilus]|uniref:hypothetical protein n=1 Tax=Tetragenococcus halophilus TaxID=51669 RepID=UPI00256BC0AA|nr:hypothetical protein [Tetragenococcus halophilus]GMG69720.1 hypothetical protein TEHOK1_04090 [Tetragenococcus halophilus]